MTNPDADPPANSPAREESPSPLFSSGGVCVACGSILRLRGPDASCETCLARFAFSPEDDLLLEDADTTLARNYGHFEIVHDADGWPVKLGRGAMGVTYRARDTSLRTEAALKVIGVNVAGHPSARAAFLREARAAAVLRHQNVATVFHYGEQDGECFYAMELVEGETLDARLRREGPLPPALVLEIGHQVACALAEAEARGIVHRDLKPSNIMFAAGRSEAARDLVHIKVIDFGLARAVGLAGADGDDGMHPAGFVGTPAFASPEQSDPEGLQEVDTRSDIYSLGVTMWYLLCGKLPFDAPTIAGIRAQQASRSLPLEQLTAAKVPAPMVSLLQRMLKVRPDERIPSAQVLLEALEALPLPGWRPHSRGRSRWFVATVLLILTVALILAIAVPRRPADKRPPPESVPQTESIAVLPFEQPDPQAHDQYFSDGVQQDLSEKLSNVAAMKVVSPGSAEEYTPGHLDYRLIGQQLAVDRVLEGGARRADGKVKVWTRLVDTRSGAVLAHDEYEQELAGIFALESRIVRATLGKLRVPLTPEEAEALDKPPSGDVTAYDLYLQARGLGGSFPNPAAFRQHLREMAALYERAIAKDPKLVLAYCDLAMVHDDFDVARAGSTPEELAVDHHILAESALQKARRLDPESGRVHFGLAYHYSHALQDEEQARLEAEIALRRMPNNGEISGLLGSIARHEGRWDDALRHLRKAAELQPRVPFVYSTLNNVLRETRRYPEADQNLAQLVSLTPPDEQLSTQLDRAAIAFEQRADLTPLRAGMAAAVSKGEEDAWALTHYGLTVAIFSRDAAAMERLLPAIPANGINYRGYVYPKAWFGALAARLRGDAAAARAEFAAARTPVAQAVLSGPGDPCALGLLAMIDAGLGRVEDATREGRRACELAPPGRSASASSNPAYCLAVVYAWTGQTDLAFDLLDKLVEQPASRGFWNQMTYGDLCLGPFWDPLRADGRFEPLVQCLAPRPSP